MVIRDITGILHVICKNREKLPHEQKSTLEQSYKKALGGYAYSVDSGEENILFPEDVLDADELFNSPEMHTLRLNNKELSYIDRMILGQDWLKKPFQTSPDSDTDRIIFYSIKGGVGRSTALSIAAHKLSQAGKKVLVFDFDLESPGVSSLLLPQANWPRFGIVDWFVEDLVGQSDTLTDDLFSISPLSQNSSEKVFIVPSFGRIDFTNPNSFYISKLARVYSDNTNEGQREPFADRMYRFLSTVEKSVKPDVTLIDSRAGLHDLAAISVTRIPSARVFLFAIDTPQTWNGYNLLFSHWQKNPAVVENFRDTLKMVDAMMPETEQQHHQQSFLQNSYNLFSSTIYEEILPGKDSFNCFNFGIENKDAPHFPSTIRWNRRFQEFNPVLHPDLFSGPEITASYGAFYSDIESALGEVL
ncbi:MAG: hypothetical protein JW795_21820 [Chitinivibrionales bacterium]|nr:hypothetical protein [Chitinivibrionales bacterium]